MPNKVQTVVNFLKRVVILRRIYGLWACRHGHQEGCRVSTHFATADGILVVYIACDRCLKVLHRPSDLEIYNLQHAQSLKRGG